MGHDASKVLMGSTKSSDRESDCIDADPTSFPAGTAVRFKSDGTWSKAASGAGRFKGISLGRSLSDTAKTSVCVSGNEVPVEVTPVYAEVVVDDLTFRAVNPGAAGNNLTVALLDELEDGTAVVESFDGTDLIVHIEGGTTTAQAIADAVNEHAEASLYIEVIVADGEGSTAQAAAAEDAFEGGSDVAAIGSGVYIDDVSGIADVASGSTLTGAIYVSGPLTGVKEDGTECICALIDMGGGL